jgi:hypothetical protein
MFLQESFNTAQQPAFAAGGWTARTFYHLELWALVWQRTANAPWPAFLYLPGRHGAIRPAAE